jgi:hypothetical protein
MLSEVKKKVVHSVLPVKIFMGVGQLLSLSVWYTCSIVIGGQKL